MMDPITATGLAASIINILDFGIKTTAKCAQMYKTGSTRSNDELESSRQRLPGLMMELDNQIKRTRRHGDLPKQEQDLSDLAQNCHKEAESLMELLESVKAPSAQRKRHKSLFRGLKGVYLESRIKGVEENLKRYTDTLQTDLLVELRRGNIIANEQLEELQFKLLDVYATKDAMETTIRSQHDETRQHFTTELEKRFQNVILETGPMHSREVLLESLKFPDIGLGRDDIADPHEETCQWIFESVGQDFQRQQWDDFSNWLRTGSRIYWIQGKAGSGKSTLMNYIRDSSRTLDLLSLWAQDVPLLTPTFFFWSSGTALQQSSEGLLRSLIYQVLSENPDLEKSFYRKIRHNVSWNEEALRKCFLSLVQSLKSSYKLCFFIDGLDEFSGDWLRLIELFHRVSNYHYVKLCVASRPENAFKVSFDQAPSLRVQDFTAKDMERYVANQLSLFAFTSSPMVRNSDAFQELVEEACTKAQGVWQWVSYAISSLVQGRINCDSLEQVKQKLDELPEDLDNLYKNMLGRVQPQHQALLSEILVLLQDDDEIPYPRVKDSFRILHSLFKQSELQDEEKVHTRQALADVYDTVRAQWSAATMGLVDMPESYPTKLLAWPWNTEGDLKSFLSWIRRPIMFCHKSVQTFSKAYIAPTSVSEGSDDQRALRPTIMEAEARYEIWKLRYFANQFPKYSDITGFVDSSIDWNSPYWLIYRSCRLNYNLVPTSLVHLLKIVHNLQKRFEVDAWFSERAFIGIRDSMGTAMIDNYALGYLIKHFDDYSCPSLIPSGNKASYLLTCSFLEALNPIDLELVRFLLDRGAELYGLLCARPEPWNGIFGTPWEYIVSRIHQHNFKEMIQVLRILPITKQELTMSVMTSTSISSQAYQVYSDYTLSFIHSQTLLGVYKAFRDAYDSDEVVKFCDELEADSALAELKLVAVEILDMNTSGQLMVSEHDYEGLDVFWSPECSKSIRIGAYDKIPSIQDCLDAETRRNPRFAEQVEKLKQFSLAEDTTD